MDRKRILLVDDCPINVEILRELFQDTYDLDVADNGDECLERVRTFSPDLVLLDIMMPGIDGYETCRQIKASPVGGFTQVILVSGKASAQERLDGYQAGADDYVVKPFDHDELLAKVRVQFRLRDTLAELWVVNAKIREFNSELERLVQERTAETIATRDVAVFALAKLAESRDPETGQHLERMRRYSRILADELSRCGPYVDQVNARFVDDIWRSSPLHDVGKVGVPDAILLKPSKLTPQEFSIMKSHATIGADALEEASRHGTSGGFLTMAVAIARYHHERLDGTGYPEGLLGMEIPLSARIVAVADVFDALTSARVYKPAYCPDVARNILEEGCGTHFDPAVMSAFRACYDDFLEVLSETEASGSTFGDLTAAAGSLG